MNEAVVRQTGAVVHSILAAQATAGATPLWQNVLALLGTVVAVLGGVYLIMRVQVDALNKRIDSTTDAIKTSSDATNRRIDDIKSIGEQQNVSVIGLDNRLQGFTGRLDKVIEQQGAAARELAATGTQLRDVLDRRLEELNRAINDLAGRIGRLEAQGRGSSGGGGGDSGAPFR